MRNTSINNVAVKPREIKMEYKVMKKPTTKREPWTEQQHELLKLMVEDGRQVPEMVKIFGRTDSAIRKRMSDLGLSLKQVKVKPKTVHREPKVIKNDNHQAPVNMAQMGLLFSQMDDMYDRSRNVSSNVNDMKSFLVDARDKAENALEELKQTQQMVKASMVLNTITLGALAWIILS
jgi:hypothetical protein